MRILHLFLISFFLLLILRYNSITSPFERDEGEYAYSANLIMTGGVPYRDSFLQKPPVIVYIYMLGKPRIWAFISAFVVCVIFVTIAYKIGKYSALFIAVSLPFTLSFPYFMGLSANTEIFMLVPLSIFFYQMIKKSSNGWLYGGLTSIALLIKPVCLYLLIFWYFWLIIRNKNFNFKFIFQNLISFVITSLIILLPFIRWGVIDKLIESAFVFNIYYAKSWGFSFNYLFRQIWIIVSKWLFVVPLFSIFLFQNISLKRPGLLRLEIKWLIVGSIIAILLSIFQSPIGHYYLTLMPWLFLALSYAVRSKYMLLVLLFLLFPIRQQFLMTDTQILTWVYGTENPFFESKIVADEINKITKPNDQIFIGGSEPQIYYYAKRKSTTRFVITYPLNIKTPLREQYQIEAMKALEKSNPKVIVISTKGYSGLWDETSPRIFIDYLKNILDEKYELYGAYVWYDNGSSWMPSRNIRRNDKPSLIVYKLKQ